MQGCRDVRAAKPSQFRTVCSLPDPPAGVTLCLITPEKPSRILVFDSSRYHFLTRPSLFAQEGHDRLQTS